MGGEYHHTCNPGGVSDCLECIGMSAMHFLHARCVRDNTNRGTHRNSSAQSSVQVCTGSEETYDVASMAELLFGEATTVHNYAAHRMLSEDRTFFKQTNRSPARFQPRLQEDVQRLIAKAEAEAKVRQMPWLLPCQATSHHH